ncbi:probable hemolysin protein [Rhizobium etli CFN 42]|uniref:Probable hemolysin protein n=1 Tax=Rhizobium etli (strain ATCC 51251 / DSM 11541 / JCM 21823 / NBRC 15573 / CFN 42) TaxID=347834 RepID=Q2KC73_RHIEC|nr:glycosyltransferase [Rhizobium etli]ABC89563.1 probable hemolysin protein [Rhizobium etli CFN 42]
MSSRTPVAIFTYNRAEHTERALDALCRARRIEDCDFYFYSDGPKTEAAQAGVEATREVLRRWAPRLNATVVERPGNLGLAKSIFTGVSDLCDQYGRVVVVEDDLVVNPDFLHFMIDSLDRYENETSVMQVGGLTLSPPSDVEADAFMLPVTTTWGWATWKRAWQHFSWVPEDLEEARRDNAWRQLFDLNGTCMFSAMLEDRIAGRNDSWGILWWYAVSRRRGLVLYPRRSLVWNGGFDGSGVHCGDDDFLGQGEVTDYVTPVLPSAVSFPSGVVYDARHLSQLEDFFRSMQADTALRTHKAGEGLKLKAFARGLKSRLLHAFG